MKTLSHNDEKLKKLSKALYVLSQLALRRKLEIKRLSNNGYDTSLEAKTLERQQRMKQLSRKQQFFHAERMEIIRYLIHKGKVHLKEYIQAGDFNYGIVKIGNYDFYVIINKRMIERFKPEKIGCELTEIGLHSPTELDVIMFENEAEKVFKLFLGKVRSKGEKIDKGTSKHNREARPDPIKVLSKTVTPNGNIVVVKKRRFADAASNHI